MYPAILVFEDLDCLVYVGRFRRFTKLSGITGLIVFSDSWTAELSCVMFKLLVKEFVSVRGELQSVNYYNLLFNPHSSVSMQNVNAELKSVHSVPPLYARDVRTYKVTAPTHHTCMGHAWRHRDRIVCETHLTWNLCHYIILHTGFQ